MGFNIKKILFTTFFNSCLFTFLIIGLQNNSTKSKVNLLLDETVNLPISFIIGISFISGSITASVLTANSNKDN